MFFIGRGIDCAAAQEASLKLKEISYIHSEAYAGGELKHGTISLIEEGTVVIALACDPALFEKTISNVKSVKARGADVILVTNSDFEPDGEVCDHVIKIPSCPAELSASLSIIPMQLFSYYVGAAKGCDIDKPRNLAKSVTVE
jgi:glucosamine--fructose-6-phosphate aminotransferase (isomerizing)